MKKTLTTNFSPRVAAALFFGLFSIFFLLFTYFILLPFEKTNLLSYFPSLFAVLFFSALFGAIFGKILAKKMHPLSLFFLGWLLALVIVLALCFTNLLYHIFWDVKFITNIHHWRDYFIIFGLTVLSVILIIGLWLFPLTGLAAIYFSKRFYPGLIATSSMKVS